MKAAVTTRTIGNLVITRKKSVTRPVLKHASGEIIVKFQSPIFKAPETGEGRAAKDSNGNPIAPPDLAHVIDLTDGEEKTLVINKVLGSELQRAYPDNAFVGKAFVVEKFAAQGGKKYATYAISEVDVADASADEATPAPVENAQPVEAETVAAVADNTKTDAAKGTTHGKRR